MEDQERFKLKVSDNGIGNDTTTSGFGTQLINLLSKQLGAQVTTGNDGGYWTRIEGIIIYD